MLRSIRSKVLLAILGVTLVTACLITIVFYFKSSRMIEENYSSNLYGRVKQMVNALDDSLQEIYYVNIKAASDESLLADIIAYQESKDSKVIDRLAENLRNKRVQYKDIGSLYLVLPDEGIAVTSEDYPVCKRGLAEADLDSLEKLQEEEAVLVMAKDLVHESPNQLSCVQPVTDQDGIIVAYLLANVEERTLFYEYLEPVLDGKASQAIILDKNNLIITGKEYHDVGRQYDTEEEIPDRNGITGDGKDGEIRFFFRGAFSQSGLYLTVQKSEVLKDLKQMQIFLLGIFFLFLFVAWILASYIARAMYRPIKRMTDTVEKVGQGDLSLRVEVETRDEIGVLSGEFNHMLDHIETLITQVIEEERQKKDAELEALQYQITPHFMYNTLNSIKYAALIKGEKELGGLIGDFVELLQASINKKGTFIRVADEIHILKNFIHLQEFRYQGCFDVKYVITPEAENCYIPRLILQPLAENAILHGMDMKDEQSMLVITGSVADGQLTLTVMDNGRGMTKEQIERLLNSKAKKTNGLSGIGVPNVKERLKLYYDTKGGIRYESDGKGTKASIFLPADRRD